LGRSIEIFKKPQIIQTGKDFPFLKISYKFNPSVKAVPQKIKGKKKGDVRGVLEKREKFPFHPGKIFFTIRFLRNLFKKQTGGGGDSVFIFYYLLIQFAI